MTKFAVLNNGIFESGPIKVEEGFDPGEGRTLVVFNPEVHVKTKPSRTPPIDVGKKQFLFELFTVEERAALLRQFKIADIMSNWTSGTPTMTEGLYRTLVDAKENLDTIEKVRLAHADTQGFLTLCGYLGVFGQDAAVQASRISTIVNGVRPDGTYIEE